MFPGPGETRRRRGGCQGPRPPKVNPGGAGGGAGCGQEPPWECGAPGAGTAGRSRAERVREARASKGPGQSSPALSAIAGGNTWAGVASPDAWEETCCSSRAWFIPGILVGAQPRCAAGREIKHQKGQGFSLCSHSGSCSPRFVAKIASLPRRGIV